MDGSGTGYLEAACDYVHLNPVRAKLLGPQDRLLGYPWSSLVWYVAAASGQRSPYRLRNASITPVSFACLFSVFIASSRIVSK